jgi:soluble lytic murein transglycosylase
MDENLVLAMASYNAGPHRVRGWLPSEGEVEAAAWIDNIPFTETRRYVRRVLAYSAIYEHHLGRQPTRLNQRMPPVPARANL